MPDTRTHRGAHPEDATLFSDAHIPALKRATAELCWLLDHGYALRSSLALTGDRHRLTERQRLAVKRCSCSSVQQARRSAHERPQSDIRDHVLWIDGYNLLITIEAAVAGAVVLAGRDGCFRDMASLHGSYRAVAETEKAAELIGHACEAWGATRCQWLLDRPVGNSARLKGLLLEIAAHHDWAWDVDLEYSPDSVLSASPHVIASSDSVVLDRCGSWINAARLIIEQNLPSAKVIELNGELE